MKFSSALVLAISVSPLLSASVFASPEHDAYSKLFPFHAEYCAVSQIKPVVGESGGIGGHAIVFVQGLCKDPSVKYPKVIPCSEISDPAARGDGGVGISVDSQYRNINWAAYPGYDLFSNGYGYDATKTVDQAALDRVIQETLDKHVFDGVKFNADVLPNKHQFEDTDQYRRDVAVSTLGTDYAIQFGRDMKCIRFPLAEAKLKDGAKFLNDINAPYLALEEPFKSNPQVYQWSGIENNCAHLSGNFLAAMGIRKSFPINLPLVEQVFHLAIPRNGVATLQDLMHHGSVRFKKLHKNTMLWNDMVTTGWAPVGFGAISEDFPVFKTNAIYQTDLSALELLPAPIYRGIQIAMRSKHAFTDPRYNNLKTSAEYWLPIYQAALDEVANDAETPDLKIYRAFITGEIARTNAALATLTQTSVVAPAVPSTPVATPAPVLKSGTTLEFNPGEDPSSDLEN